MNIVQYKLSLTICNQNYLLSSSILSRNEVLSHCYIITVKCQLSFGDKSHGNNQTLILMYFLITTIDLLSCLLHFDNGNDFLLTVHHRRCKRGYRLIRFRRGRKIHTRCKRICRKGYRYLGKRGRHNICRRIGILFRFKTFSLTFYSKIHLSYGILFYPINHQH